MFSVIWSRIEGLAGHEFKTKRGLRFSYHVEGNSLLPSRTDYRISREDFHRAFQLAPLPGPGAINDLVRGPAYVWSILHDIRVSRGLW